MVVGFRLSHRFFCQWRLREQMRLSALTGTHLLTQTLLTFYRASSNPQVLNPANQVFLKPSILYSNHKDFFKRNLLGEIGK